ERSPRVDPRGVDKRHGLRDSAAPDARGDREDGDPADAAAHQLEQAGSGANSRSVPSNPLQQDEEARHPRRRQSRARVGDRPLVVVADANPGRNVVTARGGIRRLEVGSGFSRTEAEQSQKLDLTSWFINADGAGSRADAIPPQNLCSETRHSQ